MPCSMHSKGSTGLDYRVAGPSLESLCLGASLTLRWMLGAGAKGDGVPRHLRWEPELQLPGSSGKAAGRQQLRKGSKGGEEPLAKQVRPPRQMHRQCFLA